MTENNNNDHESEGDLVVPSDDVQKAGELRGKRTEKDGERSRVDEFFMRFLDRSPPPQRVPTPDITDKLEPEHISSTIEMMDNSNKRFFGDRRNRRYVWAGLASLGLLLTLGFLLVLVFTGNTSLLQYLLETLVPYVTGGVGGGGALALIFYFQKDRSD